ncbi:MAG: family 20 glycosylhydrolase [Anaerolineae bacterium]|nr:family 20 glycosylhydrolase [Anaerolineae bacterium]
MESNILLLPQPRSMVRTVGFFELCKPRFIQCTSPELRFSALRFQSVLQEITGIHWPLTASQSENTGLSLQVLPAAIPQPQGYHLRITPAGIQVQAYDAAGIFYAVCTLVQLLRRSQSTEGRSVLPCLEIHDWPDFPVRGVMLDISRDKVPTLDTLYALVDRLAGWKINQLQLYTEHTFAYHNHRQVWQDASPMTGEEILALDAYCRERYIELVPNQNSFGHMQRWLEHDAYAHLAEVHGEIQTPWNTTMQGPFSLAPEHPGSIALLRELYDDLLPHFTSTMFNVGCDETFDLGMGQSRESCESRGVCRVYLDFLLKIYREVRARGLTMQFWGDIILQHPELVPELPQDVIALAWGYEADHPFDEQGAQFAAAGVPFYVCPGTSSWCSIAGRTDNALGNLRNAAENGLKHGAVGYLNTDWGDLGHWQVLPVSYLGLSMGAAYSWCFDTNSQSDVAKVVSAFAFDDLSGILGQVVYDLGKVHQVLGVVLPNSTPLFWALQRPVPGLQEEPHFHITPELLMQVLAAIDAAIAPLDQLDGSSVIHPDMALGVRELRNTAHLLQHAVRRCLLAAGQAPGIDMVTDLRLLLDEYRKLWLLRNRPGGLRDSVARLERCMEDY